MAQGKNELVGNFGVHPGSKRLTGSWGGKKAGKKAFGVTNDLPLNKPEKPKLGVQQGITFTT